MRTSYYPHLARQIQQQCTNLLYRYLLPDDYSKHCNAFWVLSCLVLIGVGRLSLSAVRSLRGGCSRETLRQALLAMLPDYQESLRRVRGLLRASLPRGLQKRGKGPRRRYPLAVDLHCVPYYKRRRQPPEHVRKGRPLPGTCYSHQYASAALLHKGRYYTVALTVFFPDEDMASVLKRLLQQAAANGFPPRYVLMDRSFWSTDVFLYLQRARYPFLVPVQPGGKKPTATGGPTGTRAFLYGCKSGWYTYRVASRRQRKRTAKVRIGVQCHNYAGRRGRHGRYTWAYAVWRVPVAHAAWLHQCHRRRFRIESSYRLIEAARARTSSRNENLRLWYFIVATVLLNRWLEVRRLNSRRGAVLKYWWNRLLAVLLFMLLYESYADFHQNQSIDPPLRE